MPTFDENSYKNKITSLMEEVRNYELPKRPFYDYGTKEMKFNYVNYPIAYKTIDKLVPYIYYQTDNPNVLLSKYPGKDDEFPCFIVNGYYLYDQNPGNVTFNKVCDFATFIKLWYCGKTPTEDGERNWVSFLNDYPGVSDCEKGTGFENDLTWYYDGGGNPIKVKPETDNILNILKNFYQCRFFAFNELTGQVELTAHPPFERNMTVKTMCDEDIFLLRARLKPHFGEFPAKLVQDAVAAIAKTNSFNPVADYLKALPPWDGKKRVEGLLIDTLGADDTDYVRAATRKFMAGAVKRAMEPGCTFQYMPVLVGAQGIGKSTLFRKLLPQDSWFTDGLSFSYMDDKTAYEICRGVWLAEIPELSGMSKQSSEYIKRFITQNSDKYREAYAKHAVDNPRHYVLFGTTNDDRFLSDPTGNRRYWPIYCRATDMLDWGFLNADYITQLWAEAISIYKSGEELYMDSKELATAATAVQREAMNENPWVGMIENYLSIPLPQDWYKRSKQARREYIQGVLNGTCHPKDGYTLRERVCTAEIWNELFAGEDEKARTNAKAIIEALRQVPGINPSEKQKRDSVYGNQRFYAYSVVTATEDNAKVTAVVTPITDEVSELHTPVLMVKRDEPPEQQEESYLDTFGIPEEPPEPEDYRVPDYYLDGQR